MADQGSHRGGVDFSEETEEIVENKSESRPVQTREGGRGRGHVGHTDEELEEMRKYDLRRVKRIMANRSSAARSKVRKLRYTNELDSRIAALSNEQRGLEEEFYAVQVNIGALSKENDFLCDEIRKLQDEVAAANTQSTQLKQAAHALRMQVLSPPLTLPRSPQATLANFQAAARNASFTLQVPQRQPAANASCDPLLSFTSSLSPSMTAMNLENRALNSNMVMPDSLGMPALNPRQPPPYLIPHLWSGQMSTSSTGSALSTNTLGKPPLTDRRLTAEDPALLNMLQSMDLGSDLNTGYKSLASDVSSQTAMYNSGSSWNPRPSVSQMLSSRSSLGSFPLESSAWNLLSLSPAATDASLLPLLAEAKQYRRSAGDFPLGLPEPLQGLARYPRNFSTPHQESRKSDQRPQYPQPS